MKKPPYEASRSTRSAQLRRGLVHADHASVFAAARTNHEDRDAAASLAGCYEADERGGGFWSSPLPGDVSPLLGIGRSRRSFCLSIFRASSAAPWGLLFCVGSASPFNCCTRDSQPGESGTC